MSKTCLYHTFTILLFSELTLKGSSVFVRLSHLYCVKILAPHASARNHVKIKGSSVQKQQRCQADFNKLSSYWAGAWFLPIKQKRDTGDRPTWNKLRLQQAGLKDLERVLSWNTCQKVKGHPHQSEKLLGLGVSAGDVLPRPHLMACTQQHA